MMNWSSTLNAPLQRILRRNEAELSNYSDSNCN